MAQTRRFENHKLDTRIKQDFVANLTNHDRTTVHCSSLREINVANFPSTVDANNFIFGCTHMNLSISVVIA